MPAFTLKDGLGKCIALFSTSVKTLCMQSIDNNEQRVRQCFLTNSLTLSVLICKYLTPEKLYCLHRCIRVLQFLKLEGRWAILLGDHFAKLCALGAIWSTQSKNKTIFSVPSCEPLAARIRYSAMTEKSPPSFSSSWVWTFDTTTACAGHCIKSPWKAESSRAALLKQGLKRPKKYLNCYEAPYLVHTITALESLWENLRRGV